jgi:hypothetical protein
VLSDTYFYQAEGTKALGMDHIKRRCLPAVKDLLKKKQVAEVTGLSGRGFERNNSPTLKGDCPA